MNQRLRIWHFRLGGRTQDEPPASRHDSESEATTALFSCAVGERTYISKAMDACSKCGESVTHIPTERELARSTSWT
jgi:hypothetical protein